MQKNIAKGLTVGALALTVGLSGFGSIASANSTKVTKAKTVHVAKVKVVHTKTTKTKKIKTTKVSKTFQRTLPGKVASVGTDSLKLTSGNKTYTVTVGSTSVLDRNRKAINLSDIQVGDRVNVAGAVTGLSVNAKVVRDVTLPKSTISTTTN